MKLILISKLIEVVVEVEDELGKTLNLCTGWTKASAVDANFETAQSDYRSMTLTLKLAWKTSYWPTKFTIFVWPMRYCYCSALHVHNLSWLLIGPLILGFSHTHS